MKRFALALLMTGALVSCDWMPGKPDRAEAWKPHDEELDFLTLFDQNCRGCHGMDGSIAGSISLDQPTYLDVIPEGKLKEIIANGVPGSNMPGFSHEQGGMLTDKQIDVLVRGILERRTSDPGPLPPYAASLGSVGSGLAVFGVYCASCHGANGSGGSAGSVVEAAYLGLVSDQYLRTIVIAGRPELGCPDFRSRVPGKVMTDAEISDVTAWLASNRQTEFGTREGAGSRLSVDDSTDQLAERLTGESSPTPTPPGSQAETPAPAIQHANPPESHGSE